MSKQEIYVLSSVKGFKGHDGEPLKQGNLKCGTKVVAEWSDDSWGGPTQIHFKRSEDRKAFIEWAKEYLKDKYCLGKPYKIAEMTDPTLEEYALMELIEHYLLMKEATKLTKGGLLAFIVRARPDDERAPFIAETFYNYKNRYFCDADIKLCLESIKIPEGGEAVVLNELVGQHRFTDEEAETMRETAWLKGLCAKSIVVRWKDLDTQEVTFSSFKAAYNEKNVKEARARYPHNIVEIVNERFAKL